MRIFFFILIFLSNVSINTSWAGHGGGDRNTGEYFVSRSPVIAREAMVATSHPLASQVAIDILKQGGSAVDAAIAANAALGVMEPTGSGIGGDLFAIVWDPKARRLYGLNASGRSALGQSYDELKAKLGGRDAIPLFGPLSISVPGAVDGWDQLHKRFGTLPWKNLFQPAIHYSQDGFPVTQVIAKSWKFYGMFINSFTDDIGELDNYQNTFLINGKSPIEGQIFRNPDLATTLGKIANQGRDVFYQGDIADKMDAYFRRTGSPLRKKDFSSHKSEWVEPVSVNYRGYDVFELPPNGQGIAALQMLNILEAYDLKAMGHNSAEYLHVHTEAKKLAYADRAKFYADMAFSEVPLKGLLSKKYAEQRRKLVNESKASEAVSAGNPRLRNSDTIYLTIADKNGMMVSLIQSNYLLLGSGLVPDGLGFMFQNRGALYSMEKGHANVYAPGKRPFHTIIPSFIIMVMCMVVNMIICMVMRVCTRVVRCMVMVMTMVTHVVII
ncbi:MAG: gamma-glutamyltransferase family protein, partial [Pseudomonadales bacterium]|nr:gamma-glutamyltransferase family protein [Pseudomonadales bacterium]